MRCKLKHLHGSRLQNNQMPTVLKSVITADTFFFTENRDLKAVITANRSVFETAIPRLKKGNYRKTAPKIAQNRITANPYAPSTWDVGRTLEEFVNQSLRILLVFYQHPASHPEWFISL